MGWLNNVFEAIKNFPEITIPVSVGVVILSIGLSLLKSWRVIKAARISASKIKEMSEELKDELNGAMEVINTLRNIVMSEKYTIQAFTETILNQEHNHEEKEFFESRLAELTHVEIEQANVEIDKVIVTPKKRVKRHKAGA